MMLCGHCGAPVARGEPACGACGTPIDWGDERADDAKATGAPVGRRRIPTIVGALGGAMILFSTFLIFERTAGVQSSGFREVDVDLPRWGWRLAIALVLPVVVMFAALLVGSPTRRETTAGAAVLLAVGAINIGSLFILVLARLFDPDEFTVLAAGYYVKFVGAFLVLVAGAVGWLSLRTDPSARA